MSEFKYQRKKDPSRLLGSFQEKGYNVLAWVPRGDHEKLEWYVKFTHAGQTLFDVSRPMKEYPTAEVSERDQGDLDRYMIRLIDKLPNASQFSGVTFMDMADEFGFNAPAGF